MLRKLWKIVFWSTGVNWCLATIIAIPQDYPTIQEGLNALVSTDTLLIEGNRYEEILVAPRVSFVMIGLTRLDSTGLRRVTIDGSQLTESDTTAVLTLVPNSQAVIQSIDIRNTPGRGIRSWADSVVLRDCRIDSVIEGFRQMESNIGAHIFVSNCRFSRNTQRCLSGRAGNYVEAEFTTFSGGSGLPPIVGANHSVFRNCQFSSTTQSALAAFSDGPHLITNCVFGPATAPAFTELITAGDSKIEFIGNTFRDCVFRSQVLKIYSNTGDSVEIRENNFLRCRGSADAPLASSVVGIITPGQELERGALVSGNYFSHCSGNASADDIVPSIYSPAQIVNNRFEQDSLNGIPSIVAGDPEGQQTPLTLRDNEFLNCGYAVNLSAAADARLNYWGHNTGPYHEFENPSGLGDTITGSVQFIPWLTDTTTSVPHFVELPNYIEVHGYPNPFNSTVMIEYALTREQVVTLAIYDVLGRQVEMILNERQGIGVHTVLWNADEFASGFYFARLSSDGGASQSVKLMLLK